MHVVVAKTCKKVHGRPRIHGNIKDHFGLGSHPVTKRERRTHSSRKREEHMTVHHT
ncbi:triphosphate tunel metalloenzyme 3-like [Dorcoceras hygrometricum]|uniref:Triphosphate tunel metalloenzyme 3-like n=1 Tax=Dorcoceras hygrometricum TaxID=472368 RepID=A0A2Z7AF66_9LAMI|nr:triphosphate tunel metalloenzyme 3-like [Dorcoceras hygrometricum]